MCQPNEELRDVAEKYNLIHRYCYGLGGITEGHYVPVNVDRASAIAREYEELATTTEEGNYFHHLQVVDAYEALVDELAYQWQWIIDYGYVLEPWQEEGQPYANSKEMQADLRDNKHLYYFTGGEPHPFLSDEHPETGVIGNEMLRAVHDVFGHTAEGYGFGPRGEENTWIHHSMMFSNLAQRALTTETRGQNSWVNYGPHKDLPIYERPYAQQKVDLLPSWCWDWKEALGE